METSTAINVYLSSDDCKDIFPDNKPSNFRVRLPREFHLNESWKCGLADIVFTNSRYTFDSEQSVTLYDRADPNIIVSELMLQPRLYRTAEELIADINRLITENVALEQNPQLVLTKHKRVHINPGYYAGQGSEVRKVVIKFSDTLTNILGLKRWGIPFLQARQSSIFVYASIVKQRVVGDAFVKLLRIVGSTKAAYGKDIVSVFKKIYFCHLDVHNFQEIEIQLLDDTGKEPAFSFGSVRLTLRFEQHG